MLQQLSSTGQKPSFYEADKDNKIITMNEAFVWLFLYINKVVVFYWNKPVKDGKIKHEPAIFQAKFTTMNGLFQAEQVHDLHFWAKARKAGGSLKNKVGC